MGRTARAATHDRDRDHSPNSAGVVVQLVGIVLALVLAIVGLGAIAVLAIGSDDDSEEDASRQPATVEYPAGADLATALACANSQPFDAAAHLQPDPSIAVPDAFQCTVDDKPVFAYVYLDSVVRESALNTGRINVNLCGSFPADPALPQVQTGFDAVVGTNWIVATRDDAFADELDQRLGGGGIRDDITCAAEG